MRKLVLWGTVGIVTALGFDIGKHWYFKNFLETQIKSSSSRVAADKIDLRFRPFASTIQIQGLSLKNDQGVFQIKEISLRQSISQFRGAHVQGSQLSLTDYVTVAQVQGVLLINRDNNEWVFEGDPFHFITIETKLPNVQLKASTLETTWHYFTKSREIDFSFNAPQFAIDDEDTISLRGGGRMNLVEKPKGNVDLRVSGVDRLSNLLVKNKVISKTQAQIINFGGQLLGGQDGEVPLPLRFEAGKFYLGPVEIG
jgi:hypothetical protein